MRADARGMGRYVRGVLRDLATRSGSTLTLLVRDARDATDYQTLIPGAAVAALSAARKRGAFDIVWYPWNAMRFPARSRAVVTINDDFAFSYPAKGLIARWREQQPIRRAARGADRVTTISQWARRKLAARFALDPAGIGVIPLAPDRFFHPGDERSPFAEPFVLAVGTREERKNAGFLYDAATAAFPDGGARLVFVGELEARLRRRMRSAALAHSELTAVDDALLRRLYRTATVVAVPSLAEGFGLVAAEAQACGAAVIASSASALPETVGTAGILADPHDLGAWTAALRELVHDAPRNAMYRARARERWPPNSGERTTQAIFTFLQRTVDDRA